MAHGTIIEGLTVRTLEIPDLFVLRSQPRPDLRGSVAPTYSRDQFRSRGIEFDIVHENYCVSPRAGTVRGFHYQRPPFGQAKLIQVIRGRMLDVNVDLRKSSPTFARHAKAELRAGGWSQIFVPVGFAHCYLTLEDDTEVVFKLGSAYAPDYAEGLAWNDPDLGIEWPIGPEQAIVLKRDLARPRFSTMTEFFP